MSRREDQWAWFETLSHLRPMARQGVEQTLFLAANRLNNRPGAWLDYDVAWPRDRRPDFRTLLWNELCFDLDNPNWRINWSWALRLRNWLNERAIDHYFFATAGKGIHCSVFMDVGGAQTRLGWSAIRTSLFNRVCREARITADPMKAHWSDASMGSLVRAEGGLRFVRPKTLDAWEERFRDGTLVLYKHWLGDAIPKNKPLVTRPGQVEYPAAVHLWRVPVDWLPLPVTEQVRHSEPSAGVQLLIRKMVAFMAGGGNLCDYGRYAVAAHVLKAGYSVDDATELYAGTPNFNRHFTHRKLEQMLATIDSSVPPGRKAILERVGQNVPGLEEP